MKRKIKVGKLEGAMRLVNKMYCYKFLYSCLKWSRSISLSFLVAIMRKGAPSMVRGDQVLCFNNCIPST